MFHQKTAQDMMYEWVHCRDEAASHQLPIAAVFWIIWIVSKCNTKSDVDLLLYLLRHFECDGHTVHMLTQQCLPPSLTGTVKLSLFTRVHSSPLSLAARLHRCRTNRPCYINSGWTFSGQTSYVRNNNEGAGVIYNREGQSHFWIASFLREYIWCQKLFKALNSVFP